MRNVGFWWYCGVNAAADNDDNDAACGNGAAVLCCL